MTQGFITHVVQVGDSLQRLAISYNLPDWREIVYINQLEYPYIDDQINSTEYLDNPRIAKIGDSLLIPGNYVTSPSLTESTDITQLEKLAYGSDIDLFGYSQDKAVVDSDNKGELSEENFDLKTSSGIENLRQRLLIRLNTPKGSLILHPEFGSKLKSMVGLRGSVQNLVKIRLEVQETILSDDLIQSVEDLYVVSSNGVTEIDCTMVPVPPGKPFKFVESVPVS